MIEKYVVYESDTDEERPLRNSDIKIASLANAEWAKEVKLSCADAKKPQFPMYYVQDLTGAFSGEEGPDSQCFFATARGVRKFVKELGLTARVPPYIITKTK